jgi:chromatin assembly factor 1 subunit B
MPKATLLPLLGMVSGTPLLSVPARRLNMNACADGMIIIWAPSSSPQPSTYGSDLSPEDLLHEKEYWKPRITFRCSQMQVYDLAWSPTGEYVIAGSTDNTARVFSVLDGTQTN